MALSARLDLTVPPELREELERLAEQHDVNLSHLVRSLLYPYVDLDQPIEEQLADAIIAREFVEVETSRNTEPGGERRGSP